MDVGSNPTGSTFFSNTKGYDNALCLQKVTTTKGDNVRQRSLFKKNEYFASVAEWLKAVDS